jgi:hypothetical protein
LVRVGDSGVDDMKVLQCVLALASSTPHLHAGSLVKVGNMFMHAFTQRNYYERVHA